MISLTYPADWREWAPGGAECQRHMNRFKERWRRRWGEPITGVWVREFQERGAPHFHLYVGLPTQVSEAEYAALVGRTQRRKRLEGEVGKYEARRSAGFLTGEFGVWLLAAWSGSVGTPPGSPHSKFGADVAPCFWGVSAVESAAGTVNWGRIAEYFWRESGKWGQKRVPEGFVAPGRFWGVYGKVAEVVSEGDLTSGEFFELRRMLEEIMDRRLEAHRRSQGRSGRKRRPVRRGRFDGVTTFDLEKDVVLRLLALAGENAAAKMLRRREADGGMRAAG